MGRTGRWIRNFLLLNGKKETKTEIKLQNPPNNGNDQFLPATPVAIPTTTTKEKRRWSFRRSSATAPGRQETSYTDHHAAPIATREDQLAVGTKDSMKHHQALAGATADAAVAAAKAAAAVIQLTAVVSGRASAVEEASAIKIQSFFRAYLARKALNALRGLVKLQALVRGHLVRKQATETLRCMQALITVQARARAQRMRIAAEDQKQYNHRKSTQENWFTDSADQDFSRGLEDDIKIVEMDLGDYTPVAKSRNSYSNQTQQQPERIAEHRISTHRTSVKQENHRHISPAPSAITDVSPRICSNHFEEYSYAATAQSSPQCYHDMSKSIPFPDTRSEYGEEYLLYYPNYMANTESSRAKVRSQSAPKSRPLETMTRQSSRRRPSLEGRNVPRAGRMQRSSSQVGSAAQNYQFPWSVKLDKSSVSLQGSECGSTSTVITNTDYSRSIVGYDAKNYA